MSGSGTQEQLRQPDSGTRRSSSPQPAEGIPASGVQNVSRGGLLWSTLIALTVFSTGILLLRTVANHGFPKVLESVGSSEQTPAPNRETVSATKSTEGGWSTTIDLPSAASSLADVCMRVTGANPESAVECQAVCDNHYVYIHSGRADSSGSVEWNIPLRSDPAGFWTPFGHRGIWSAWETVGLRSLSVKVFGGRTPKVQTVPIPTPAGERVGLQWITPVRRTVPLGERYELLFDMDGWSGNPFASNEMDCRMTIQEPDGSNVVVGAFMFQDFELLTFPDGERIRPYGQKHWRARFRPQTVGVHKFTLSVRCGANGKPVILHSGDFVVGPGKAPDYVVVSPSNRFWFAFTSGKGFYPLGWNIPFAMDVAPFDIHYVDYTRDQKSLAQYLRMLDDVAASGCNTVGLWLSQGWCGLEGPETDDDYQGKGRYNLRHVWMFDRIMDRAEALGLKVILDLTNANDLSQYGTHYDTASAWRPDDNDEALYVGLENRFRYLIALAGDSPALHSWNYVAEPDLSSIRDNYLLNALRFLRKNDPYRHIVSNHINTVQNKPQLKVAPELEFLHFNAYAFPGSSHRFPHEDQIFAIRDASIMYGDLDKPVIVKEYGGNYMPGGAQKMDRDVVHGLWGGICSRLSGSPMTWWWEFCYGDDLGRFYKVTADFLKDEDLLREDLPPLGPWRNQPDLANIASLSVLSVGNATKRFAYVFHTGAVTRDHLSPQMVRDATVSVQGLKAGSFVAQTWDPHSGRIAWTHRFKVDGQNAIVVPLPRFQDAVALKIRLEEEEHVKPVVTVASARSAATAAEVSGTTAAPSRWTWRIVPQCRPPPTVADLCRFETRIALPAELRGKFPRALVKDGKDVPPTQWTWTPLGAGEGWLVSVDSRVGAPVDLQAVEQVVVRASPREEWPRMGAISTWLDNVPTEPRDLDTLRKSIDNSNRGVVVPVKRLLINGNPAGLQEDFAAWIRAPLFIPQSGLYRPDQTSFDDMGGARIDGAEFLPWGRDSSSRQQRLAVGIHSVEIGFWQNLGAMQLRFGLSGGDSTVRFGGLDSPLTVLEEGIPPWFVDGRVPCDQEIVRDGKTVATILPSLGLRVRKPHQILHQIRWRKGGTEKEASLFSNVSGLRDGLPASDGIPVWIENDHVLPISLIADGGVSADGRRFVRARLVGQKMPLKLIESSDRGVWGPARDPDATESKWSVWNVGPRDASAFRFGLAGAAVESELAFGDDRTERSTTQPWTTCLRVGGGEGGLFPARLLPGGRGARLPDDFSPTPLPHDTAQWREIVNAKVGDGRVGVLIFVEGPENRPFPCSDNLCVSVEQWVLTSRRLGYDPVLVTGSIPRGIGSDGMSAAWIRRFSQVHGLPVLDREGGCR